MSNKRKRVVLTVEKKLEIIKRRREGESIAALADEFGIGLQTVRDIVKNQPKLEEFVSKCDTYTGASQRKSMKSATNEQLDCVMLNWFRRQREEGTPITGPMILNKARYFFDELGMSGTFKFSSGWLKRFKERHGIMNLQMRREKAEVDDDDVDEKSFRAELLKVIAERGLVPAQIYGANETVLRWRATPGSAELEENATEGDADEDKIAILCCGNASGEDKLKLAVVGKSDYPAWPKDGSALPVEYYSDRSSWVTGDVFGTWWKYKFVPHVKNYLFRKGLPRKAILLLDDSPLRRPADRLSVENGDVVAVYVPQPIVARSKRRINETLKMLYRKNLLANFVGEKGQLISYWESLSIEDAVHTISTAWEQIDAETIRESFEKILPENFGAAAVTVKEEVSDETVEIVPDILKSLVDNYGCDESNAYGGGWPSVGKREPDHETTTDYSTSGVSPEEDVDRKPQPTCDVSCAEALAAAETLLRFMESREDFEHAEVLQVRRCLRKIEDKIVLEGTKTSS